MDNRTSSHQWLQIWIVEMHRWPLIMLIITMQWQRMCGTISICICLSFVFVFLWLFPLYFIAEELSPCMLGLVAPTVINCGIIDCSICFCFCFCICLNFVFVFLWLLPLYFIEELSPRMPGLVAPTVIGLIFTTRHLLYHSYTCGPLSSNSKSNNATYWCSVWFGCVSGFGSEFQFSFIVVPAHVDVQAVAPNDFFANSHAGTLFFAFCCWRHFLQVLVPKHWFLENFAAK